MSKGETGKKGYARVREALGDYEGGIWQEYGALACSDDDVMHMYWVWERGVPWE